MFPFSHKTKDIFWSQALQSVITLKSKKKSNSASAKYIGILFSHDFLPNYRILHFDDIYDLISLYTIFVLHYIHLAGIIETQIVQQI